MSGGDSRLLVELCSPYGSKDRVLLDTTSPGIRPGVANFRNKICKLVHTISHEPELEFQYRGVRWIPRVYLHHAGHSILDLDHNWMSY
jgi:hypothetical protein